MSKFKELEKDIEKAIKDKTPIQENKEKKKIYSTLYDKLIEDKFKIDEKYTKINNKIKYDKFDNGLPPLSQYNYMSDLIMLPETSKGYKYLFVIMDLWSHKFDCEPLKNKTADETLQAMKKIFNKKKNNILKIPFASISTDNGTEFKGSFDDFLKNKLIYHKLSYPYRHKQQGPIENLNKLINRFLTSYMNKMEIEHKKKYTDWDDILTILKTELNKIRVREDKDPFKYWHEMPNELKPKFKVGDVVYYKLERPMNYLGEVQSGGFRIGDLRWSVRTPRKIIKILSYPKNIRYLLEGEKNVSFTEDELMIAEEKEPKYFIKKIIDKQIITKNNKEIIKYLIWWDKYKKKDSTWENKDRLIEDGNENLIDEFEKNLNQINQKKK